MNPGTLRALEFDRIVSVVASLAVTPTGLERLLELHPMTEAAKVAAAQRATTEGTRVLADLPGLPLRAPSDLESILEGLAVVGLALEPLRLFGLADYLESIDATRNTVKRLAGSFPILNAIVDTIALVQSRGRRRPGEDRAGRRGGRSREPGAGEHPRASAASTNEAANDARRPDSRARHSRNTCRNRW